MRSATLRDWQHLDHFEGDAPQADPWAIKTIEQHKALLAVARAAKTVCAEGVHASRASLGALQKALAGLGAVMHATCGTAASIHGAEARVLWETADACKNLLGQLAQLAKHPRGPASDEWAGRASASLVDLSTAVQQHDALGEA
jgi:hypothetical protein